jgi:2-polyprenyl-3-methyl-5-hydroxy-6-metoxy-1,4-benzoquinol methylase
VSAQDSCPVCGSIAQLLFRIRDVNRRLSDETFTYHRCPSCELIFLAPVPSDLGLYYPSDYYGTRPSLEDLADAAAVLEGYKLELVRRFVAGGRLLDIGPGLGGFACLAKRAGFDVEVIEMDAMCCSFLSEVAGIRAINSAAVAPALQDEGGYDVITLWHVIEHLPDPWETLAAASSHLQAGGIIVIAAPNPDALQFRLLKRRWAHLDAPRHLFLIPLPSLLRRAHSLGLVPAFRTTTDEGGINWNAFGWRESLGNMTPRATLRPLARAVASGLTHVAAPLERTGLRGSTYTVVLRRGSAH